MCKSESAVLRISLSAHDLKEYFGSSKLEVSVSKNRLTDLHSQGFGVFLVMWTDSGEQDTVALDKLVKRVSDGISRSPNSNRLHHSRITQLPHTENSVKHLDRSNR